MIPAVVVCVGKSPFSYGHAVQTGVRRVGFRYVGASGLPAVKEDGAVYKREDKHGAVFFVELGEDNYAAAFLAESGDFVVSEEEGPVPVVDYPAPPLPVVDEEGELRFTRFIGGSEYEYAFFPEGGVGYVPRIDDLSVAYTVQDFMGNVHHQAAAYLLLRYDAECSNLFKRGLEKERLDEWLRDRRCNPPLTVIYEEGDRLPGSSRLVGEEYRVKEVDGDYLRLVGRGKEEYLAWDFVLGTLDSGEWVLMGEDGLYLAEYKDGVVVVEKPYDGLIIDVRGPPRAYLYPVVATSTFRHIKRLGEEGTSDESLLRWPLTIGAKPELVFKFSFVGVYDGLFYWGPCHLGYE